MNAQRLVRRRRVPVYTVLVVLALVVAACGSGTKAVTSPSSTNAGNTGTTGAGNAPLSTVLGTGVTAHSIKIGVALVDFKCIAPYIQSTRVDEYKVYDAFINDINAHGGVGGRNLVPVYHTFCPIVPAPALSLCTTFTEDDHVFAVLGDFVDLTGQAQPCIANQHKTVLITIDLTQSIINSSPPGMILTFDALQEREVAITLELLAKSHTLVGKKVAVLGEATTEKSVNSVLVPGLKKQGVNLGSTAILDIAGSDTTAASAQLKSFIEKWKTEKVDTVFISGLQVSAQQFVPDLVKGLPGVQLIADNTNVDGYGQNLEKAGVRPNPYEGILAAAGESAQQYDQSANWKTCAAVYEHAFHQTAPNEQTVVPGPNGHTLDITGSITDACAELTIFKDVAERAGKYLNDADWVQAVDNYGTIPVMQSLYGSIHTGKYDADDTFALAEYDHTIPPEGDWHYLTPLENVSGG